MQLVAIVKTSVGPYTQGERVCLYGHDAKGGLNEWRCEGYIVWFDNDNNLYVELELEEDEDGHFYTVDQECFGHGCACRHWVIREDVNLHYMGVSYITDAKDGQYCWMKYYYDPHAPEAAGCGGGCIHEIVTATFATEEEAKAAVLAWANSPEGQLLGIDPEVCCPVRV